MNLFDNNNEPFKLLEYQGTRNLLVIFFRGAWCNHCKRQLQDFQKHLDLFNGINIKLLALSNDSRLNSSLLKEFLKLDFPVLSDVDSAIINRFELGEIYKDKFVAKPALLLLSPEGRLLHTRIGANYDDLATAEETIEQLAHLA